MSGDRQRVYYAEVDDSCRVANYAPIPEIIPVRYLLNYNKYIFQVHISMENLPCLLRQPKPFCPPACLYMIYRLLYHRM